MQIVMVSGSRNREGRTARMLEAVAKGIAEAGGSSETIFLPELISKDAASVKKTAGAFVRPSTAVSLMMTLHPWSPN